MIASLKNKICHSVMARIMSVLIIFLSLFNNVNAKDIKVGFSPGYGNYSLCEIKDYQEQVYYFARRQLPGIKMFDQFPDYFNFSAWMEIKIKRHSIGLNYTSLFTGARHTISDYSGSYTCDMHLNAQRNSAYYKYWFYEKPGINPLLGFTYLKFGKTYSKLQVNENLEIYDLGKNELNNYYSAGGNFMEFGFGCVFKALRFLEYSITLGYDKDFSKEFKDVKRSGSYLENLKRQKVVPNWSGMRLTVGINISIAG